jgi:NADPH-dependent 2,4-dienoyl-CoA reductase/sulfur reductase-like enzyme
MPLDIDVLVVGGSVAGARCVEALRHNGFDGSVRLVSDESEPPYDRPPLSKQFLAGDGSIDHVRLLSAGRAAELGIELELGTAAVGLDPATRTVALADGRTVTYGTVVIATGAVARPSPWGTPPGVHTLRDRADAERLRAALTPGARVVVVGGGWIGAEVAAAAHSRGGRVTVVDVMANPYTRAIGAELGQLVCGIHARHGVEARFGTGVVDVRRDGVGLVVELTDGDVLAADAVVVGIGAIPNTDWLAGSGLTVADGVACDGFGRALGVDDVWAVGDVARWGERRHEHWTSAVEQARAVGHNIAHPDDLVDGSNDGYVWSDQYGWKIQLAGDNGAHCEVVVDDPDVPRVAALYRDGSGRLVGVAAVNWPRAFIRGWRAIGVADALEQAAELRGATANVAV